MPEILEIEFYRRAALAGLNREIVAVAAPDAWYLKGVSGAELADVLVGQSFVSARRRGKLMLLDVSSGPVLGMRFGMTGRLVVDGKAPIDRLEYGPGREDPAWERFAVDFADGGRMMMVDPRRLGGVSLDPDEEALGPDVWEASVSAVREALGSSVRPLKARLMDQARLAGLGNLLTDETLWRSGLAPTREARSLSEAELTDLHRTIQSVLAELAERGGSHTGDLQGERPAGGHCPRDGAELRRETVGGRTTVWCPKHQH